MVNVLNCKLAVGTRFAAMDPAGGNRLRDGAARLHNTQSRLAGLRRCTVIVGQRGGAIDPTDERNKVGPARGQAPQTSGGERRQQELTNVMCRRSEERANGARSIEPTSCGVELNSRSPGGVGTGAQKPALC